jgi:hypothetical protein
VLATLLVLGTLSAIAISGSRTGRLFHPEPCPVVASRSLYPKPRAPTPPRLVVSCRIFVTCCAASNHGAIGGRAEPGVPLE